METPQVVSAGDDGALYVAALGSSAAAMPCVDARSSASYRAVRWSSPTTFVAAGTTGGAWLCTRIRTA